MITESNNKILEEGLLDGIWANANKFNNFIKDAAAKPKNTFWRDFFSRLAETSKLNKWIESVNSKVTAAQLGQDGRNPSDQEWENIQNVFNDRCKRPINDLKAEIKQGNQFNENSGIYKSAERAVFDKFGKIGTTKGKQETEDLLNDTYEKLEKITSSNGLKQILSDLTNVEYGVFEAASCFFIILRTDSIPFFLSLLALKQPQVSENTGALEIFFDKNLYRNKKAYYRLPIEIDETILKKELDKADFGEDPEPAKEEANEQEDNANTSAEEDFYVNEGGADSFHESYNFSKSLNEVNPMIGINLTEQIEEALNKLEKEPSFKQIHKCTGCGNSLDKCTCLYEDTSEPTKVITDDIKEVINFVLKIEPENFGDDFITALLEEIKTELNKDLDRDVLVNYLDSLIKEKETVNESFSQDNYRKADKIEIDETSILKALKTKENDLIIYLDIEDEFNPENFGYVVDKKLDNTKVLYKALTNDATENKNTASYDYVIYETDPASYNKLYFKDGQTAELYFNFILSQQNGEALTEDFSAGCATQPSNIGQHKMGCIDCVGTDKKVNQPSKIKDISKGYSVIPSKYFPDEYVIYLGEQIIWSDIGTIEDGYKWIETNL